MKRIKRNSKGADKMDKEKIEEKCELIISDINNIIDDLNFDEMKLTLELVVNELKTILKIIEKF